MRFLSEVTDNLLKALDISWKGMVALFVAMFFIFLSILILNKVKGKNN